jgi:ATP/maltotriose-dependent transcriptional regulator MalT
MLIGREAELTELDAAVRRIQLGQPAVVLMGGEAGVGKTRLVTEILDRAGHLGVLTLSGGCLDVGDGVLPYAPVVEALRQLGRTVSRADLDDVLGDARQLLARLVPELASPAAVELETDIGLGAPSRVLGALLHVLHRLAAHRPVLLAIEDLHWADRSTRELLAFLVRNLHGAVLLVMTYRDDVDRGHPLREFLAELDRGARVEHVDLSRFARHDVARLIEALLRHPPPSGLTSEIMARSGGNAFYTEELTAAYIRGDRQLTALRGLLLTRVEALSRPAQQIVATTAVAGGRVDHDLLAEVAGLAPDELVDLLREAIDQQILATDAGSPGGGYAFRHALIREAVYEDLLQAQRRHLHARFASSMAKRLDGCGEDASLAVDLGQLARHWYAAFDMEQAMLAFARAGMAAEAAGASAEALHFYLQADGLWEQAPQSALRSPLDRSGLRERAAEVAFLLSDFQRAVLLAQLALNDIDQADGRRAAVIMTRIARYYWISGDRDQAAAAIAEAKMLIPEEPASAELASVLATDSRILILQGRNDEARSRSEQALAVAQRAGARAEEGRALTSLGIVHAIFGSADASISYLHQACAIASVLGAPEDILRAHQNLATAFATAGRYAEAITVGLSGCQLARRYGIVRGQGGMNFVSTAMIALSLGRWREAEALLDELLEADPPAPKLVVALAIRAQGRLRGGDSEGAAADLDAIAAHADVRLSFENATTVCSITAGLYMWQGHLDKARTAVSQGLTVATNGVQPRDVLELCCSGICVEAVASDQARARRARDDEQSGVWRAEPLIERARAAADELGPTPPPVVTALLVTAEAEWVRVIGAKGPNRWAEAATAWTRLEFPYPAAYAHWRQAEALLLADESRPQAARVLAEAWRISHEWNLQLLVTEIESLARRAHITLPRGPIGAGPSGEVRSGEVGSGEVRSDPAARFGLTRREREVLALIADGRTNRQIAGQLFISDKTASVHVSNILRKLCVTSRSEAAVTAHRLGIAE